jgi:hypothetical protein
LYALVSQHIAARLTATARVDLAEKPIYANPFFTGLCSPIAPRPNLLTDNSMTWPAQLRFD